MTAEKVATVSCNTCLVEIARKGASIPEVRQEAQEQGWIVRRAGGRDYCPACLAAFSQRTARGAR